MRIFAVNDLSDIAHLGDNSGMEKKVVYLSLGSNLGDRAATLQAAVARLAGLPNSKVAAVSAIIETAPWGLLEQPAFLNMALTLNTALTPEQLLVELQQIEEEFGRQRHEHWGARTLDIDMLYYQGEERESEVLRLPHPYLTERRFVLQPLAEIAPELLINGKSVRQWLAELPE